MQGRRLLQAAAACATKAPAWAGYKRPWPVLQEAPASATRGGGCYKRRRSLLHAAAESATSGGGVCYTRRRRRLLHTVLVGATSRCRRAGEATRRPPAILLLSGNAATKGRWGYYIGPAVVLPKAGGGARRRRGLPSEPTEKRRVGMSVHPWASMPLSFIFSVVTSFAFCRIMLGNKVKKINHRHVSTNGDGDQMFGFPGGCLAPPFQGRPPTGGGGPADNNSSPLQLFLHRSNTCSCSLPYSLSVVQKTCLIK
jgi:hypothetical protein